MRLTLYVFPWWSTHCLHASGDTHCPWCKTVPPVQKQPSVGVSIQDDLLPLATNQSPGNVCMLPQSSTHPVRHASYSMEPGHCNAIVKSRKKFRFRFRLGVEMQPLQQVNWNLYTSAHQKLTYGRGGGSSSPHTLFSVCRGVRRQKWARTHLTPHMPAPHTWQGKHEQECVHGTFQTPQNVRPDIPLMLQTHKPPYA